MFKNFYECFGNTKSPAKKKKKQSPVNLVSKELQIAQTLF